MAKRRDRLVRVVNKIARDKNISRQRIVNLDKSANGLIRADGGKLSSEEKAVYRARGRRGVRARARRDRIMAMKANGTYTQPGGGTGTNSP